MWFVTPCNILLRVTKIRHMCVPKCDIFWSYKISYRFVTLKYYPIMCILYVTHLRLDFIKPLWNIAVGDMILTPIMCFGSYKIIWEGLEPFGKTSHFLCWNWSVAAACGSETSGRGHRPKVTNFSVFSIFVERLKKPK